MFRYVLLFTFAITVTLEPVFKINGKYFLTKILRKQQTNLARLQQIKKKTYSQSFKILYRTEVI